MKVLLSHDVASDSQYGKRADIIDRLHLSSEIDLVITDLSLGLLLSGESCDSQERSVFPKGYLQSESKFSMAGNGASGRSFA